MTAANIFIRIIRFDQKKTKRREIAATHSDDSGSLINEEPSLRSRLERRGNS